MGVLGFLNPKVDFSNHVFSAVLLEIMLGVDFHFAGGTNVHITLDLLLSLKRVSHARSRSTPTPTSRIQLQLDRARVTNLWKSRSNQRVLWTDGPLAGIRL